MEISKVHYTFYFDFSSISHLYVCAHRPHILQLSKDEQFHLARLQTNKKQKHDFTRNNNSNQVLEPLQSSEDEIKCAARPSSDRRLSPLKQG